MGLVVVSLGPSRNGLFMGLFNLNLMFEGSAECADALSDARWTSVKPVPRNATGTGSEFKDVLFRNQKFGFCTLAL